MRQKPRTALYTDRESQSNNPPVLPPCPILWKAAGSILLAGAETSKAEDTGGGLREGEAAREPGVLFMAWQPGAAPPCSSPLPCHATGPLAQALRAGAPGQLTYRCG